LTPEGEALYRLLSCPRTWPGRVLSDDDDACWTYFRRGLKKPAPVDDSVNDRSANVQPTVPPDMREWSNSMAAMAEIDPEAQATPWIDRWPDMIVVPPKPVFVEPPQPLMRNVLLVIAIATLCVALVAVAFGGTAPNIFSCQAASTFPEAGLRFGELWQFRPASKA
jgi:hypothetical protein